MKSVLITGASKGLGRALLEHYISSGWVTFPLVRSADIAEHLRDLAPEGVCNPIVADVCDPEVETLVGQALSKFEGLNLLINCAGVSGRSDSLESTTPDEAAALFDVHVLGTLRLCRASVPFLENSKNPLIINISSRLASLQKSASGEFAGKGFSYTYRIAKAAQNMLTVCLAEELNPRGISVTAIHPGQFVSDSSASGASKTAAEAAESIANWISTQGQNLKVQFVEPDVGPLPW